MTGLAREQVDALVTGVHEAGGWPPGRRRALELYPAVVLVLLYLRHNLPQDVLGEVFGCSQPTASRLIARLSPVIDTLLVPLAEQVAARELASTVRVDGFLAPTGDRRLREYNEGMFSGKRHHAGFNIQVVASWRGRLVLTGQPMPGAMHDSRAWTDSGLAARFAGRLHLDGGPGGYADLGYLGTGLLTPIRKPKGTQLTASARDFNRQVASQRAAAERAIAHLKNWRILATGYRRLLADFPATLRVITKLEIYRTSTALS
jgi:hypothetical protein